jgi:hypothetical protein
MPTNKLTTALVILLCVWISVLTVLFWRSMTPKEISLPPSSPSIDTSGDLHKVFVLLPGMTRDEVIREVGILDFKTRPGLRSGETWAYSSSNGENIYLNFDSDDRLVMITDGLAADTQKDPRAIRRPLLCRSKIVWLTEKATALDWAQRIGATVSPSKGVDANTVRLDSGAFGINLHFSSEGKLIGFQLTDPTWLD